MPKRPAPARMLRAIVTPALGLSLAMLATAATIVTGCGTSSPSTGSAPEGTEKIPPPGAVPPSLEPLATATATATATAIPTATEVVGTSDPPPPSAPLVVGISRPPPPGLRPMPHLPGITPPPKPGTTQIPHPGKVAPPGFAPSGAPRAVVVARPTRPTRRSTDPDRRALFGRSRALV
ncbi:MAG: hypothetical protein ABI193_24790 [Minicystis sp.]